MDVAVERVRDHGRTIITEELRRLEHRTKLSDDQLAIVEGMLDGLFDRLFLGQLQRLATHRPELLAAAVEIVDPEPNRLLR